MSAVPVVPPSPANVIACGIVFPIVAGGVVALRFYCRRIQRVKLEVDDWLTLPAWLFMTGMAICIVIGVYKRGFGYPSPRPGPGQDPTTFTHPEIIINRKLEFALELFQFPALTSVKLSFLFFYKRIFCTRSTVILNWIIWTVIALCIIWGVAFFFAFLFVCGTHFSSFWGTPIAFKTHCSIILPENYWIAITDFMLDAVIFFIPMPLIFRLQMSTTRKFGLLAIFAVGALTLAASITRMVIFVNAVQVLKKAYKSSGTNNLTVTAGLYWTVFECGLGLIAACMPAIYVLLKRFSVRYIRTNNQQSKESLWSWRTVHSKSQQPSTMNFSVSEIELVPADAPHATINTRVEKQSVEDQSRHNNRHANGICVSKTVQRAENMI
ncbi:hypothetical protein CC86DRAFT_134230 [Ophiobolus disseminans]|uniref:Rhodopsin domain-containing protein n=1 Tax=Ophiobolus disseminans TaxID=1469910 RepID=A0A6A7ACR2_9PLEO|nr:hypothetical protein CC86DRAFT_134230 [Ophiobolus disseminans]